MATLAQPVVAARLRVGSRVATVDERGSDKAATLVAAPIAFGLVVGAALAIPPLTMAAIVAALLAAVAFPYAGLAIVAFSAPLAPPTMVPAPGFQTYLVGAILLGCIYRLPIDRPRLTVSPILAIVVAYVLYVTVQQAPEMLSGYAGSDAHAVGFLFFQLLTGLGLVIAAGHLLRARSPNLVLGFAVAGAALTAVVAIANFDPAVVIRPLANLTAPSFDIGRATGTFSNPNYLGSYVAIMVVATLALFVRARSRSVRVSLAIVAVLLSLAVATSLSRGALIAAVAGLAVLAVYRWRLLGLVILAGGLMVAVLAYPAFVQWRLESLTGSALPQAYAAMSQSDDGRLVGVLAAPLLFLSAPLFGIGFGHFVPMSVLVGDVNAPINAHNWYLTVLAEQGVVGVVLWILLGFAIVRALRRRPQAAAAVGFPVLTALAVASMFLEPPTTFQLLAVPVIVIAATLVSEWTGPDPVTPEPAESPVRTVARTGAA